MLRKRSIGSRACNISASARLSVGKNNRTSPPLISQREACSTNSPRNFSCARIALLMDSTCASARPSPAAAVCVVAARGVSGFAAAEISVPARSGAGFAGSCTAVAEGAAISARGAGAADSSPARPLPPNSATLTVQKTRRRSIAPQAVRMEEIRDAERQPALANMSLRLRRARLPRTRSKTAQASNLPEFRPPVRQEFLRAERAARRSPCAAGPFPDAGAHPACGANRLPCAAESEKSA